MILNDRAECGPSLFQAQTALRTQVSANALLAEHVPALGNDHILLPLVAHVAVDQGPQRRALSLQPKPVAQTVEQPGHKYRPQYCMQI